MARRRARASEHWFWMLDGLAYNSPAAFPIAAANAPARPDRVARFGDDRTTLHRVAFDEYLRTVNLEADRASQQPLTYAVVDRARALADAEALSRARSEAARSVTDELNPDPARSGSEREPGGVVADAARVCGGAGEQLARGEWPPKPRPEPASEAPAPPMPPETHPVSAYLPRSTIGDRLNVLG